MKLKKLICTFLIGISITGISFADEVSEINALLTNFGNQYVYLIPNAAVQTNVYADAWIGKFLPSIPMHFAAGIDGGISKFDISDLKKAGDLLHIPNLPDSLLFPTFNVNAKIGGFLLPFDVGISAFCFNTKDLNNIIKNIDLEFFTIGGNVRFAIFQGIGILPKWSIGAGYYYSQGSIGKSTPTSSVKVSYKTQTFVAETQVSKTFICFTPFIGFRALFSDSDIGLNWNYAGGIGSTGIDSFEVHNKKKMFDDFIPQLFGGVGLKVGLLELDINGSYDFKNSNWTAGAAIRFQM